MSRKKITNKPVARNTVLTKKERHGLEFWIHSSLLSHQDGLSHLLESLSSTIGPESTTCPFTVAVPLTQLASGALLSKYQTKICDIIGKWVVFSLVRRVEKYLNMRRGFLCRSLLNTDNWVCGLFIWEKGFIDMSSVTLCCSRGRRASKLCLYLIKPSLSTSCLFLEVDWFPVPLF